MLKEKPRTREQLLLENNTLKVELDSVNLREENVKKEFAKAFGWKKYSRSLGYSREDGEGEPTVPSWSQVFVELGKLLSMKDFRDLENNVTKLEETLNKIHLVIYKKGQYKHDPFCECEQCRINRG